MRAVQKVGGNTIKGRPAVRRILQSVYTLFAIRTQTLRVLTTTIASQGYLTLFETTLSVPSVNMESGTLVGGGTIEGSVTNNGYVLPTNGETLTVTGDYTQTAGGELSVTFSTTYPPALVVKSNATLSGTLSVGVNLKHPPKAGSTYTAVTFGSLNGEFKSFTVEGGGTVQYTNDSVVVTFR